MQNSRLKQARTGFFRAAIGLLVGAAVLAAPAGRALAEDDDEDDLSFEQKMIRNFLGGMGAAGTGAGIEYRERSPLVIPPARNLPPPEADVATKPAPNWPADPEKRRKVAKKDKKPMNAREAKLWDDPGRPLTPEEMRVGRTTGGSISTVTAPGDTASESAMKAGRPLPPSALGSAGGLFGSLWGSVAGPAEETAKFEGEPPRTSLTAPPTGYMTPSPNQPYGVGAQKYVPPKPVNPGDLPAR